VRYGAQAASFGHPAAQRLGFTAAGADLAGGSRGTVFRPRPTALPVPGRASSARRVSLVRATALRSSAFSLVESCSIGFKGRVRQCRRRRAGLRGLRLGRIAPHLSASGPGRGIGGGPSPAPESEPLCEKTYKRIGDRSVAHRERTEPVQTAIASKPQGGASGSTRPALCATKVAAGTSRARPKVETLLWRRNRWALVVGRDT
jgi:hypothetical protein